jgi:hypothetical protein
MNLLKNKKLIFPLSYLIAVIIYWPALNGTPAWDDFPFWFEDPVMKPTMSYLEILKNFAWPFSVIFQKFLYNVFNENYYIYHLINLSIHFLNAFLVYKLAQHIKLNRPFILFFLFLVHPVCVITTAWMIQIKTLLCFFFALASCLTFFKGNKDWRWMTLSWVLFLFSVASKSASLGLPLIFTLVSLTSYRFMKIHLLIPFFLIAFWGGYRVAVSPLTIEGTQKASQTTEVKEVPSRPDSEITAAPLPSPEQLKSELDEKKPELKVEKASLSAISFIRFDVSMISKTLHYYFWQVFLPIRNEPIKGLNTNEAGFAVYGHLIFLALLIIICWGDSALISLAAGHILLLPFLGIIPAPYMLITWVSDQHLYLALPCLLAFWLRLIDKLKWKHTYTLPTVVGLFFLYKTSISTPFYKDQFAFYEASLDYNPENVPIIYNLAFAYVMNNEWDKAKRLLQYIYERAQTDPSISNNQFYPQLLKLYIELLTNEKK